MTELLDPPSYDDDYDLNMDSCQELHILSICVAGNCYKKLMANVQVTLSHNMRQRII